MGSLTPLPPKPRRASSRASSTARGSSWECPKHSNALYKITALLESEGVPYAIIGAFALNEYGHRRVTVDVDLVMRDDDLQAFKKRHLGRRYTERVPGTVYELWALAQVPDPFRAGAARSEPHPRPTHAVGIGAVGLPTGQALSAALY